MATTQQIAAAERRLRDAQTSGDQAEIDAAQRSLDALAAEGGASSDLSGGTTEQTQEVNLPSFADFDFGAIADEVLNTPPPPPEFTETSQQPLDQATSDANFLAEVEGRPLGELTPEELNRLLEIQRRSQQETFGGGLDDAFGGIDDVLAGQEEEARRELEELRESEGTDLESRLDTIRADLDAKFAPRFDEIRRNSAQAIEDTQRGFSFAGTGRGTRAQEARQEVIRQGAQLEAALAAERSLEEQILVAQARGASAEAISGLTSRLSEIVGQRQSLELDLAERRAQLELQLAEQGVSAIEDVFARLETAQFDPNLSAATGRILDVNGQSITGVDGRPLEFASIADTSIDEFRSSQQGVLVNANGEPLLDLEGNPIQYRPGLQGFTTVGNDIIGIFTDGTASSLTGGGFGGGTTSGVGSASAAAPSAEGLDLGSLLAGLFGTAAANQPILAPLAGLFGTSGGGSTDTTGSSSIDDIASQFL